MGLTDEEVLVSRQKYGSNEIKCNNKKTFITLLISALADPIIKILLLALTIKIIFLFRSFDWFETIGIMVAIFLATFISTLSEFGSEKAFLKLQEDNSKLNTSVYRNKKLQQVYIDDIVVNDIIMLNQGDKVPADGYLIEGNLSVDESSLNGETKESKKISIENGKINKENKVYKGTVIYNGKALIKIDKVGLNTIYGKISAELQEKVQDSPLKVRLKGLAKIISRLGYLGAFVVCVVYLFINIVVNNNYDLELIIDTITNFEQITNYLLYALTLSVTIIVVAVPEGLPMMITLVLSSNMKKMLKDNVLIRNMVGVETAGNINYLLTDKTGTLTKGVLEVTKFISPDNKIFNNISEIKKHQKLYDLLYFSIYLNNESSKSNENILGGNSTDKALLKFYGENNANIKIISRETFDSTKKYSSITINDNGIQRIFYKGAAETLLNKCNYCYDKNVNKKLFTHKKYVNEYIKNLMQLGNRVIILTEKSKEEYIYIGLVCIKDELRKESYETVKSIKNAGVNIIMITGDSLETAKVLAKESGITNCNKDIIFTSDEFNKYDDDEISKLIDNIKVIARALPQDKSRLVKIIQKKGYIVGMTGDGVNDAAALKKADVGFSMGSGTEVAKEASDIIILDDNILSIRKTILYGRTIFKSIRKFIIYQLSINVCALLISIIGSLIGISEPITIIQMLWLNMIMDTFAGLAFSFETPLEEYMQEKPKKINEPIMNKYMLSQIVTTGLYSSVICLLFLKVDIVKQFFRTGENNIYLYTAYFALFIFLGVYNAFNARTTRINIFSSFFKNKIFLIIFAFIIIIQIYIIYNGGILFRTYGLTINELLIVLIIPLSVFPVDIIRKIYFKSKGIQSLV